MDLSFQTDAWNQLVAQFERLPHALLLYGPQGVGKLHLAERFAQLLLCESADRATMPCGRCDGCRWFLAGHHPDARFVEPEAIARQAPVEESDTAERPKGKPSSEIRIEQIRALPDFLNIGSHRGGRRVAIVHPAEAMNAHAANALLKSLEEPPQGAIFLLVSHRPSQLLATIRSRCVPMPIPLPDRGVARAWLEGQGIRDAPRWLDYAGGAPLRALDHSGGERGPRVEQVLKTLASGEMAALENVNDREALEMLADALQKHAFDRALATFGLPPKYGTPAGLKAGNGRNWLAYARHLGRMRALARHPVNTKLHAVDMLSGIPRK